MADLITDVARKATRVLKKQYDSAGTAFGTDAALPISPPYDFGGVEVAMGMSPSDGMLSFVHDFDADTDISVYFHSNTWAKVDPASKGWILVAESAALNTKNVLRRANATIKIPANVPYFLRAGDADVTNCMVSGSEHPANPNTDYNY